jgi:hypothetical protein
MSGERNRRGGGEGSGFRIYGRSTRHPASLAHYMKAAQNGQTLGERLDRSTSRFHTALDNTF